MLGLGGGCAEWDGRGRGRTLGRIRCGTGDARGWHRFPSPDSECPLGSGNPAHKQASQQASKHVSRETSKQDPLAAAQARVPADASPGRYWPDIRRASLHMIHCTRIRSVGTLLGAPSPPCTGRSTLSRTRRLQPNCVAWCKDAASPAARGLEYPLVRGPSRLCYQGETSFAVWADSACTRARPILRFGLGVWRGCGGGEAAVRCLCFGDRAAHLGWWTGGARWLDGSAGTLE